MRQTVGKMQRRLSCQTDPIGEQSSQQQQQQPPFACSSPSRALSQHGKTLRRTSAQDSVDSAFSMLSICRRKGSDSSVGQIQPDLYRRRGSVISVGSNGTAAVLGRLQLQLSYDHSRSDLLVRLVQATLTPPIPAHLLPPNGLRVRVSVPGQPLVKGRESEALVFNEEGQWTGEQQQQQPFKLPLGYNELMDSTLLVELLSASSSEKSSSGQESPARHAVCSVPLGSLGPSADDLTVWADLERASETLARGELLVCLQYLPAAERLTLSIHRAANLRLVGASSSRNGAPTDLFIRAQLVGPEEKVLKRRKSGCRKAVPGEPVVVWDEVLGFEKVEPLTLARCRLDLHLLGSDRFGRGERLLGQLSFGPASQRSSTVVGSSTVSFHSSASFSSSTAAAAPSSSSSTTSRLWPPDAGRWTVPRWIALESAAAIASSSGEMTAAATETAGQSSQQQQQQQHQQQQQQQQQQHKEVGAKVNGGANAVAAGAGNNEMTMTTTATLAGQVGM